MKKLNPLKQSLLILSFMTGLSTGHAAEDRTPIRDQFSIAELNEKEKYYSWFLKLCFSDEKISSEETQHIWNAIGENFGQQEKDLLGKLLNLPQKALYKGLELTSPLNSSFMKNLLREQIIPKFPKKNIKTVKVVWDSTATNQVDLDGFKSFIDSFPENLDNLYFMNLHFENEMFAMLGSKIKESNLKELDLRSVGITSKTAKIIVENIPQTLEVLVLEKAGVGGILGTLGLEAKPNLKYLSLRYCGLTDTDIQNFTAKFSGNKNLKALMLSNNSNISDQSATTLKTFIETSSLEMLHLGNTSFTGAGLKTLSPAIKSKLKYLNLGKLKIEAEEVKILIDIIKNSNLERLVLTTTDIIDKDVKSIAEAVKESNLTEISFNQQFRYLGAKNIINKKGKLVKFSFYS